MIYIFVTVILLIAGFFVFKSVQNKKDRKEKEEAIKEIRSLSPQEKEVVQIIDSNMENKIVPVSVVRNKSQKIPQYGDKTWTQVEKDYIKQKAGAFFNGGEIFIKRFDRETGGIESMERFAKLYIHEAAHTLGLRHGEEMTRIDRENMAKILPILKEQNLI